MVVVARHRRTASFLSRWGAVTAALCVVHLALALAIPDAPLRISAATPAIEWGLLSQEFIALGVLAVVPALPGTWYTRALMSLIAVLVLAGGWITFVATGRFPGIDGARFLFTVPEQSFEHLLHIRPLLLWSVPITIVLGTIVLTRLALHAGKESQTRQAKALVLTSAAIVGLSLVWHGVTKVTLATDDDDLYDLRTGVSYRADLFWEAAREDRAGPASALLRSSLVALRGTGPLLPADPRVPVERPPRRPGELAVRATPQHRWNVLVIEVESMRADVLSAWGSPRTVMPTVEAIAREGRRYLDTYTTATQTNLAAVTPLSGQYPLRSPGPKAYPARVAYPKLLLYDLLAPEGWRSAVFSSQNESWWGMVNFLRSPSLDTLFNAENFRGHTTVPGQDMAFAEFVTRAKRSGKIDDHDTALEALRWLQRDHDRPFFLYVNMQTSHIPYETAAGPAHHPFGRAPSFPVMFGRYPAESVEVVRNQYRNALAYIDQQVDLLRRELIADGRWDSTIVVVTGDHGEAFFEHGVAAHANGLWQEEIRVPLVVRAPHLAAGDDARPASHVDIAPTIAALLGLPPQPAWQGIALTGDAPAPDRPRFIMVQSPLADERGVISGRWKLVRNTLLRSTRLTDLVRDPGEHRDATAQHPADAAHMLALLDTWRAVQLEYYDSDVLPDVSFAPRVHLPEAWAAPTADVAHRHAPAATVLPASIRSHTPAAP